MFSNNFDNVVEKVEKTNAKKSLLSQIRLIFAFV